MNTPRRGRWRRIVLALVAVALVLRVGLGLALPWLLDRAARAGGCTLRFERSALSLLGGSFALHRVELRAANAAADAAPLWRCASLRGDLQMSALLVGGLRVREVAIDGAELHLHRDADGRWQVPEVGSSAAPTVAASPAVDAPKPLALDFSLPVAVDHLRVAHLRVHCADAAVTPPFAGVLHGDLHAFDLGMADRPARLTLELAVPGVLDALRIDGELRGAARQLGADLHLVIRGLQPAALQGYLAAAGMAAIAQRWDGEVRLNTRLAPRADDSSGTRGSLQMATSWSVDGRESARVADLSVEVAHLDAARCDLDAVNLRGVRADAERRADGGLRVLGLDLPAPAAAASPVAPAPPPSSRQGFGVRLRRVALRDLAAVWRDGAVTPPAQLELQVVNLAARDVLPVVGPGARCELDLAVTDAIAKLHAEVDWTVAADGVQASVTTQGQGITLAALAPYLAQGGWRPLLRDGALQAAAKLQQNHGQWQVELSGVQLRDGDLEWLALDRLAAQCGADAVHSAVLQGVRARAERGGGGELQVAGLATVPSPEREPRVVPPAPAPRSAAGAPLRVGSLQVGGVALAWRDASVLDAAGAPTQLAIDDLALEVENLELGAAPQLGRGVLRVRSAAALEQLALTASASRDGSRSRAEVGFEVAGLRLHAVHGYLRGAGVELIGTNWQSRGVLRADLGEATADLELRDLELGVDAQPALRLGAVRVEGFAAAPQPAVARIAVERPELWLARDAGGALMVAGLRLPGDAAARTPAEPEVRPEPRAVLSDANTTLFSLGGATLRDGRVHWHDSAVSPELHTAVGLGVDVERVQLTGAGLGAPLRAQLEAALGEGQGRVRAQLAAEPGPQLQARASLQCDGVVLTAWQPYLPGHIAAEPEPRSGGLQLGFARGGEPGAMQVDLTALQWGPVGASAADIALREARLHVTRADPAAGRYDIALAALRGIELSLTQHDDGWSCAGVRVRAPAAATVEAVASEAVPASAAPAPTKPRLPEVTVAQLSVELARLTLRDVTDQRPPLEAALRLEHDAPLHLSSAEPETLPPLLLRLRGQAAPLCSGLAVDLSVAPFAAEPELSATLQLQGIAPAGLRAWVPGLADRIDSSASQPSTLQGQLIAHLRPGRGGILQLDPSDGFGAELELRDLSWTSESEAAPWFGVGSARVDLRRIAPRRGDVHVASVEVDNLRGRVEQLPEGVRAGGILWRSPPAAASPPATEVVPAPAPSPAPRGTLRVDSLAMSGLDFVFRDLRSSPPFDVPLTGLEVDVRGFSDPPSPTTPLSLQASLMAGKVLLRERSHSSSVVSGLFGAVAGVVAGKEDEFKLEPRPLFEELAVQGRLLLAGKPQGQLRVDLGSFELPALAPLLRDSGVVIGDGVLDTGVSLRFDGQGNVGVDSRFDFTHLSVSEPSGGPISTYLKLPAPLDSVLFALENDADEHKIPLAFDIGADGISASQIALTATSALGQLIARAVAAAPMRVAGTVTGLFGGGGAAAPVVPAAVNFAAGDSQAPVDLAAALDTALAQLADLDGGAVVLVHELGRGDLAPLARLANPTVDDVHAVVSRHRGRLRELDAQIDALATTLRTKLAVSADAAGDRAALRALAAERTDTEQALSTALELLRPGAERRADARTRAAARSLGELRQHAVRDALVLRDPGLAARIELRRPGTDPVAALPAGGAVRLLVRPRSGG